MTDIFISYSRVDQEFALRLRETFEKHGLQVWLDLSNIDKGEEWWAKIKRGIDETSNVVFIVSPDSMGSEVCNWELQHALNSGKRLIPVIYRTIFLENDLDEFVDELKATLYRRKWDDLANENWSVLRSRNWITLNDEIFETNIGELLEAVQKDLTHLQVHTEVLRRAREWEQAGKGQIDGLLLTGEKLTEAEAWLGFSQDKDPRPTKLHHEYIQISVDAREKRESEQKATQEKINQMAINSIRMNVDYALRELDAHDPQSALLLAMESLLLYPQQYPPESWGAIWEILEHPIQQVVHITIDSPIRRSNTVGQPSDFMQPNKDESKLLTIHDDHSVRIWDIHTGECLLRVYHDGWVRGAQWISDESRVLSRGDNTIRLWDANTGEELVKMMHSDTVWDAKFSKDESRILAWSDDGMVRIWATATGKEIITMTHPDWVGDAIWSKDENRVLTYSGDNVISIWDAQTGEKILQIAHDSRLYRVIWNTNETQILSCSEDGLVQIWDASNGEQTLALKHDDSVYGASWNSSETHIVSYSGYKHIYIWDANTGDNLHVLSHDSVCKVLWNNDDSRILSYDWGGGDIVRIWDVETGENLQSLTHSARVWDLIFNADETQLMTYCEDETVRVWDTLTNNLLYSLNHEAQVSQSQWLQSNTQVLTGSSHSIRLYKTGLVRTASKNECVDIADAPQFDKTQNRVLTRWGKTITVWDIMRGKQLLGISHDNWVSKTIWNSKIGIILAVLWDEKNGWRLHIRDSESGELLKSLPHEGAIQSAKWNAEGNRILSFGDDNKVHIWDAETGEELLQVNHSETVWNAHWNKDESLIISYSADNSIRLWNTTTGEEILNLQHESVNGARWNTDETRILSHGGDAIIIWDARSGEELRKIELKNIYNCIWSTDEALILSYSYSFSNDNTVLVWEAHTGQELLRLDHEKPVGFATWNREESQILVLSHDVIIVWDAVSGNQLSCIRHNHRVDQYSNRGAIELRWCSDMQHVLSICSTKKNLSIWDTHTSQLVATGRFEGEVFENNGVLLLTNDNGFKIRDWDMNKLIEDAKHLKIRDFNAEERDKFFLSPITG